MKIDEKRVGAEIDAYCTKCRLLTNHRIVAMQEKTVKRVICLTCDGQHNFRLPPGQKTTKPRAKRVKKDEKKSRTLSPKSYEKWLEMKTALVDEPRIYRLGDNFEADEPMTHTTFGIGFVTKKLGPQRIEVMFEKELKTLAINYQP